MKRKLEHYLSRPLPNLFFTLLNINISIYYELNEVYIHILYIFFNTYYTSFVLILFEHDVTKRHKSKLQFLNWYWFPFPILFLHNNVSCESNEKWLIQLTTIFITYIKLKFQVLFKVTMFMSVWSSTVGEIINTKFDNTKEAKDYNKFSIGVYKRFACRSFNN